MMRESLSNFRRSYRYLIRIEPKPPTTTRDVFFDDANYNSLQKRVYTGVFIILV